VLKFTLTSLDVVDRIGFHVQGACLREVTMTVVRSVMIDRFGIEYERQGSGLQR
jgi:hypothetical protein